VIVDCAESNVPFYLSCGFKRKDVSMVQYFPAKHTPLSTSELSPSVVGGFAIRLIEEQDYDRSNKQICYFLSHGSGIFWLFLPS
jgi:hypothetical protein